MSNIKELLCEHDFSMAIEMDGSTEIMRVAKCDRCGKGIDVKVVVYTVGGAPTQPRRQQTSCGKMAYKTRKDAVTILNIARDDHHRYKRAERVYHCYVCNSWHLTSRNDRSKEGFK